MNKVEVMIFRMMILMLRTITDLILLGMNITVEGMILLMMLMMTGVRMMKEK